MPKNTQNIFTMSYYDSIDTMPIFNWDKCQRGDLTFTRIDDKDVSEHLDAKAWQLLNYEYMEIFGISRYLFTHKKSYTSKPNRGRYGRDIQSEHNTAFK